MRTIFYTLSISCLLVLLSVVTADAQRKAKKKANADTEMFRYEIECAGISAPGTKLVRVWTYSKKPKIAVAQARKNAVHGIIFKGYTANSNGCTSQKPLARDPELEIKQADFFDSFFDSDGRYQKFVVATDDERGGTQEVVKVDREYKIGVIVLVQSDMLRKDLENAGVIKSLNSGF